ncbi:hypothetical protein G6O67_001855 [Ophiocordyceps sinensis]|uniref:Uncharacterized protein n=1 Tax=Ophiocordyceps sinensis TaxID=72228 RepID=A0A8H4PSY2_9HYPO|nr:hypothetical protein G6O67_001855 [Ophiocordyceps sinensis]
MADLTAASSGPAASNGTGVTSPRRPTAGPALTGSPSGIRGPRMIMQERAAREARQRAEAEKLAMERDRAECEARLAEETRRRISERPSAAVSTGQGAAADAQPPQIDPRHQARMLPDPNQMSRVSEAAPTAKPPPQPQTSQPADDQRAHHPTYPPSGAARQPQSHQRPSVGAQPTNPAGQQQPPDVSKPRNSFPHAFERWETLSAHWEGLTSYWIRKLEQNKDDVNRDPLSQQLARQVTDLSAAGANLFHAVVELQRLRASSERKFQRWFFETRAELERAREVNAMMEAALQKERRDRADAVRDAIDQERGSSKIQKQLAEMRKELSISKEEARRAWEELGRREQEERDRTFSLQTGQPTIVGGVQVVPMTHSASVSRHGTVREPASHQQEYGPGHGFLAGQAHSSPERTPPSTAARGDVYQRRQQQQQLPMQSELGGGRGSEGGYSEGEYVVDAQGNFILDVQGNRIPFAAPPSTYAGSDAEADDYETPATTNPPPSGGPESPSTSAGDSRWTGTYSDPQDYSGQGYGAPGWETVPRHHHPTRLSDVIEEEDERSRTSASQMSRG